MRKRTQTSVHTRAVKLAAKDVDTILSRLGQDMPFMQDVSHRTQAIKDRIAASPEAQKLLEQGFTQSYAHRVAKAH